MEYQSSPELRQAIIDAKRGDERAVTTLYRAFNPPLMRFLNARTRLEAEDIASGVWLSIAKNIATFEGDDRDFRAWMFSTARRRTIDLHRRQKARPATDGIQDFYRFADHYKAPDTDDQLEINQAIAELIDGLPDDQAEILLLRVVAGLSSKEVAQITARSETSVRVTQHRAIKFLSKKNSSKNVTPESRSAFSKEL